ncbi:MFS transporter [Basilea psittacipulmonis]|uniref:MFS transporter n=1 Tax=Basilea psittacipulmonis TaxID=1472345 RepID=UPI00098762A5|nr:MFS transporter [Basilea psittacipulmonis]
MRRPDSSLNFLSLFVSTFFLFAGYGLFLNSAGIHLSEIGASSVVIGALNASFFVGATLSSIAAHRIISRVGHIRSFTVFGAVFAVAALGHTMDDNLWVWFVLRIILGFCYFSLLMVVESWFTERSSAKKRAKVLGIYNFVYYMSVTFGVLLLSLNMSSDNVLSLSSILVIMAMVPVALTRTPSPEIPAPQRISIPKVFAITPLAILGSFIAGFLVNGFFTMASVFYLIQKMDIAQVSMGLSLAMIGGSLAQAPVAYYSNVVGRRYAILTCSAVAFVVILVALLWMLSGHAAVWLHYIVAFVIGFSLFTLYALSLARANDVLPNNMSTVEVSRSILFAYGIGSLVAPLVMGALIDTLPTYGFYITYVVLTAILASVAVVQRHVPQELRSVYVNVVGNTSPVMADLDPRNEDEENIVPFNDQVAQEYVQILDKDPQKIVDTTQEQVVVEIMDAQSSDAVDARKEATPEQTPSENGTNEQGEVNVSDVPKKANEPQKMAQEAVTETLSKK